MNQDMRDAWKRIYGHSWDPEVPACQHFLNGFYAGRGEL